MTSSPATRPTAAAHPADAARAERPGRPAWWVVTDRELRDLWVAGRGLPLLLAFTVLISVTTYLVATNQALNFLEQRESVSLTLQVAVAVGGLLVLLGSADAVSGERERGSLESLLLTPAPGWALVVGKGLAAMTLWAGAYVLTLPYMWSLGSGVGVVGSAAAGGLLVGFLLALFLAGFGLTVSLLARSNRVSLAVAVFTLLALYAPSQMPSAAQKGWFGDLLLRVDPFTAGLTFLGKVIVNGRSFSQEADWLVGPVVLAILLPAVAIGLAVRRGLVGSRL